MINIPEEFIYYIITDHLNYLIDENILLTFNNIKEATIYISLYFQNEFDNINDFSAISENDFFEYFTNPESATIGRMLQAALITTDVTAGTISSGIGGFSSYLSSMFASMFGSGTLATIGASTFSAFAPLLVIVLIFAIYKKINKNEVINVLNMVRNLDKLSKQLKQPIDSRVNTEFKNLLKNRCNVIDDKNLRSECAINGYAKFLNEFILNKLVIKYVEFLKNNNEDLTEIRSFNELARFKSQSNRTTSNLMNNFYSSYIKFLSGLKINKSIIGDNFRLLNNITQTALKKVN